ncbi:hypothetical protein V2G26_001384 [Clonostachys chloroleuca]
MKPCSSFHGAASLFVAVFALVVIVGWPFQGPELIDVSTKRTLRQSGSGFLLVPKTGADGLAPKMGADGLLPTTGAGGLLSLMGVNGFLFPLIGANGRRTSRA